MSLIASYVVFGSLFFGLGLCLTGRIDTQPAGLDIDLRYRFPRKWHQLRVLTRAPVDLQHLGRPGGNYCPHSADLGPAFRHHDLQPEKIGMVEFVVISLRQHRARHIEPKALHSLRRIPVPDPVERGDHHAAAHFEDIDFEPAVLRLVRDRTVGRHVFRRIGKGFDPYRTPDALRTCNGPDTDPIAIRRARNLCR